MTVDVGWRRAAMTRKRAILSVAGERRWGVEGGDGDNRDGRLLGWWEA